MNQKLSSSRAECERILREQIAEAKQLIDKVAAHRDFYEAYQDFVVDLVSWRDYTKALIEKLFPDPSLAQQFDQKSNGGFLLVAQDEMESFDGYKQEMKSEIAFLETCIKRLPMFDEPGENQQIFSPGQQFTAFQAVIGLLKNAKSSVFLIDGYVDDATLGVLNACPAGVSLRILTKNWSAKPVFKTAVTTYSKQHHALEVKLTEDYHDRFILIDDSEVHQIGGSLKDLGGKAATLIQITTPTLVQFIITEAKTKWASATSF